MQSTSASPPSVSSSVEGAKKQARGRPALFLYLGLGAVALVSFWLYLGNLDQYFNSDDFIFLQQLHFKYPNFFDNFVFFGQDWGVGVKFYRPLARLVWAAEYSLFKDNAGGWHLIGILLYSANAGLAYLLAWKLGRKFSLALLAGLLFAFHPVHTETASWIADQTDLLVGLFGLAGTIFYIQSRRTAAGRRRMINYGLALAGYALAILCKESAAAFFFVPLLYDLVFGNYARTALAIWRRPDFWLGLAARQGPFWLLLAGFLGLRMLTLGGIGGYEGTSTNSLVPVNQLIETYGRWLISPLNLERTLFRLGLAGLALLLLILLVGWEWQRFKTPISTGHLQPFGVSRTLIFGLGWIILFLLPTLTTLPSQRFVYLSTIGITLLAASLLAPLGTLGLESIRSGKLFEGRNLAEKIQQSPITNGLKLLAVLGLIVISFQAVQVHQSRWLQASQLIRSVLNQLHAGSPDLVNYSYIYAAGLPRYNEEAPIFATGFPQAVQVTYNNPTLVPQDVASFPIIEQHLLQAYLVQFSYDNGGRLVIRNDLIDTLKRRNDNIKDKKEQLYINFNLQQVSETGWKLLGGQGSLQPQGSTLKLILPQGGTFRPPIFQLTAPLLSNFELKLKATPLNSDTKAVQLVVHWLVENPNGALERTSAPLVIQTDGNSQLYRIKPGDMSPFLYQDNVSEIQLEIPPGLASLEIEQASLYRLPD